MLLKKIELYECFALTGANEQAVCLLDNAEHEQDKVI